MNPRNMKFGAFVASYYLGLNLLLLMLGGMLRGGSLPAAYEDIMAIIVIIAYEGYLCRTLVFFSQQATGGKRRMILTMIVLPVLLGANMIWRLYHLK
jgi:hypothetical protein